MAKKSKESIESAGGIDSVLALVQSVDKSAEIIKDSAQSNIQEWIPTGNYILNACMSGDMFKAIPSGRIISFCGPSGTGKSYLCCSVCREAQKLGYTPIYMDSEGAIDANFVSRLGVDPSRLIIKQVQTIFETSQFIANICKALEAQQEKTGTHDKVIFILDSLGNLTSEKERDDTLTGNQKADFTKAKDVKAMFRVNATPLARLQVPMVCANHTYSSMSFIPTTVQASGSGIVYNASITVELSAAKLEMKENDAAAKAKAGAEQATKNGILVTAKPIKSRFCRPLKVKFQIPYYCKPCPYVGIESFMTWENSGVVRGSIIADKDLQKMSEAERAKLLSFQYNGQTLYAQAKDTARTIVVAHLGQAVPLAEFYTDKVFTQEFLEYLNVNVIHPMFDLPDQTSGDDIKEIEETLGMAETPEEPTDTESNILPSAE